MGSVKAQGVVPVGGRAYDGGRAGRPGSRAGIANERSRREGATARRGGAALEGDWVMVRKACRRGVQIAAVVALLGYAATDLIRSVREERVLAYYRASPWVAVVIALTAAAAACLAGLTWRYLRGIPHAALWYAWAGANVLMMVSAMLTLAFSVWMAYGPAGGPLGPPIPNAAEVGPQVMLGGAGVLCVSFLSWVWLWKSVRGRNE
jgi:hypothetical protein